MARWHVLLFSTIIAPIAAAAAPVSTRVVVMDPGAASVLLPLAVEDLIDPGSPLHGEIEITGAGVFFHPDRDFWSLGSDSLTAFDGSSPEAPRVIHVRLVAGRWRLQQAWGEGSVPPEGWQVEDPAEPSIEISEEWALSGESGFGIQPSPTDETWVVWRDAQRATRGGSDQQASTDMEFELPDLPDPPPPPPGAWVGWPGELLTYVAGAESPFATLALRSTGRALWELQARLQQADGGWAATPWVPVEPGPHRLRFDFWGEAYGETEGGLRLWVDGRVQSSLSGLDNGSWPADAHRFGATAVGVHGAASLALDELSLRAGPQLESPWDTLAFADPFEGDTPAPEWSPHVVSDRLRITPQAAISGLQGLEVRPARDAYLVHELPEAEEAYTVRFQLDPRFLALNDAASPAVIEILAGCASRSARPASELVALHLVQAGGALALHLALPGDGVREDPLVPISNEPHTVVLEWRGDTAKRVANGLVRLWVDGDVLVERRGTGDGTARWSSLRFGAVSGGPISPEEPIVAGSLHLDGFESWRPQ